jgi:hypothetical protein
MVAVAGKVCVEIHWQRPMALVSYLLSLPVWRQASGVQPSGTPDSNPQEKEVPYANFPAGRQAGAQGIAG